jgi:hypothetical protein
MLDRPDSYLENELHGDVFICDGEGRESRVARRVDYGAGRDRWDGTAVTTRIDGDGRLDGVCVGTNYANDYTYYYNRPAMDDVHGYGPTLLCGAEMVRLLKNDKLEITGSATRPVLVVPKRTTRKRVRSEEMVVDRGSWCSVRSRHPPARATAPNGERMKWFNEARFGMFIHWGVYAVPAASGRGKTPTASGFPTPTKMPAAKYAEFTQAIQSPKI